MNYYGDRPEDSTVRLYFNTFDSNDPSASATITNLADADIKVHKDGGTTQIATDGATIAIDFDSITGNHIATIDTGAHSDYSTGSEYSARIEGTTIDGGTINAWIGSFHIEMAGGVLALAKGATGFAAIDTVVDAILADTNELQSDDVPGLIATLDAVVDTVKAETVSILADTNELQSDDIPGLIATLDAVVDTVKAETVSILADTNELQADWANGGRLDLLIDAIKVPTDKLAFTVANKVDSNALAINGASAAAVNLALSAAVIVPGTSITGTLSTTAMTTDLAEATDDHYIGRIVIWTSGVLIGQATAITDYTGASKTVTYTAVTEAPSNNDTFIIV